MLGEPGIQEMRIYVYKIQDTPFCVYADSRKQADKIVQKYTKKRSISFDLVEFIGRERS